MSDPNTHNPALLAAFGRMPGGVEGSKISDILEIRELIESSRPQINAAGREYSPERREDILGFMRQGLANGNAIDRDTVLTYAQSYVSTAPSFLTQVRNNYSELFEEVTGWTSNLTNEQRVELWDVILTMDQVLSRDDWVNHPWVRQQIAGNPYLAPTLESEAFYQANIEPRLPNSGMTNENFEYYLAFQGAADEALKAGESRLEFENEVFVLNPTPEDLEKGTTRVGEMGRFVEKQLGIPRVLDDGQPNDKYQRTLKQLVDSLDPTQIKFNRTDKGVTAEVTQSWLEYVEGLHPDDIPSRTDLLQDYDNFVSALFPGQTPTDAERNAAVRAVYSGMGGTSDNYGDLWKAIQNFEVGKLYDDHKKTGLLYAAASQNLSYPDVVQRLLTYVEPGTLRTPQGEPYNVSYADGSLVIQGRDTSHRKVVNVEAEYNRIQIQRATGLWEKIVEEGNLVEGTPTYYKRLVELSGKTGVVPSGHVHQTDSLFNQSKILKGLSVADKDVLARMITITESNDENKEEQINILFKENPHLRSVPQAIRRLQEALTLYHESVPGKHVDKFFSGEDVELMESISYLANAPEETTGYAGMPLSMGAIWTAVERYQEVASRVDHHGPLRFVGDAARTQPGDLQFRDGFNIGALQADVTMKAKFGQYSGIYGRKERLEQYVEDNWDELSLNKDASGKVAVMHLRKSDASRRLTYTPYEGDGVTAAEKRHGFEAQKTWTLGGDQGIISRINSHISNKESHTVEYLRGRLKDITDKSDEEVMELLASSSIIPFMDPIRRNMPITTWQVLSSDGMKLHLMLSTNEVLRLAISDSDFYNDSMVLAGEREARATVSETAAERQARIIREANAAELANPWK